MSVRITQLIGILCLVFTALLLFSVKGPIAIAASEEELARYRNLGKAFYENPTTQNESVEEFRKALALAPDSAREKLNYGLALLRAGKTEEGIAQLEEVIVKAPEIPHTYFNLGIEYKKQGENEKSLARMTRFTELVPDERMGAYNLGVLLKAEGRQDEAIRQFERAAHLDPNLAAARFQLFNIYRVANRREEAQKMLADFQRLKKEQEGSAIPEDVDWCDYAEIYDPTAEYKIASPAVPQKYEQKVIAENAPGVTIANGEIVPLHAVSGDFDNDGVDELAVIESDRVVLMKQGNVLQTFAGKFNDAVWLDYDHDSDLDLILLGKNSKLYRNQGEAGFSDKTEDFPFIPGEALKAVVHREVVDQRGLDLYVSYQGRKPVIYRDILAGKFQVEEIDSIPSAPSLIADFDKDGREDFVSFENGKVIQHLNRTEPRSNWIRVRLTGVKTPIRAKYAEVEVKAGTLYLRKTYQGEPLVFDLRNQKTVDTVRIVWPNGLIQNEPNQQANKEYEYKEAQRLSGSCPIIWTWDGKQFRYITDVLGVAPLGASAGDGEYFDTDHDEYIMIPGDALQERDGKLEIRITEELSEVAYLDQVQLLAVDHPADVEIFHHDKWKSPPYPEFRLWGVRERIPPIRQSDPRAFHRKINGIAEMHSFTMEFPADSPAHAALVLSGWVDWADGSTFRAASQELKDGLQTPILQAKDRTGNWVTIDADMGMPAGKPKDIVVEVKFPSHYRELRIRTNLAAYWTNAFLSEVIEPETVVTRISAATAKLHFRGFSKNIVHPQRSEPEQFFYEDVSPTSMWDQTPGYYTRYGDVKMLLEAAEDRMVIMGSGDEIILNFEANEFPLLRSGWQRDYLLLVDGWAKDRDANTAHSQTVEPLPFHGMSRYPFRKKGEQHPDPAYQRKFNTRPALRLIRPLVSE